MTTLKMKYYATGYNRNKIEAGIDEARRSELYLIILIIIIFKKIMWEISKETLLGFRLAQSDSKIHKNHKLIFT